jgi:glycosyltransferase involved in cell wall biosynthesis
MRIAFLDPAFLDYTVETPYERPLGGSQSAICYLAVELVRLGHSVAVVNGTATPGVHNGVLLANRNEGFCSKFLNQFDTVVVVNAPGGLWLRNQSVEAPLVLWLTHAHDQPALRPLQNEGERKVWSGFAFISKWQRDTISTKYGIQREKSQVLRNAVSPVFVDLALGQPWFVRNDAPVLIYTSTPFRGLSVLLKAFPIIRGALPGTRLRVFSGMSLYQVRPQDDKYSELYRPCEATEGVEYVGPIGQSLLAQEITGAAALAYPSTFAETSCIAALEAMAAGATVLTTSLGALPETTHGFAALIESQADPARLATSFADMAVTTLREMRDNPEQASLRRDSQVAFVRENYAWSARAEEWSSWLRQLAH